MDHECEAEEDEEDGVGSDGGPVCVDREFGGADCESIIGVGTVSDETTVVGVLVVEGGGETLLLSGCLCKKASFLETSE